MSRTVVAISSLLTLLTLMGPVAGNAPPPGVRQRDTVRLVVPVVVRHGNWREGRDVQAKIVIPKQVIEGEKYRDSPGAPATNAPATEPSAAPPTESPKKGARWPNPGTVIAGLALSLAGVSLIFLKRGGRATKLIASAVIAGVLGTAAWTALYADVVPPGRRQAEPTIVIELVDGGDTVTLQLPR